MIGSKPERPPAPGLGFGTPHCPVCGGLTVFDDGFVCYECGACWNEQGQFPEWKDATVHPKADVTAGTAAGREKTNDRNEEMHVWTTALVRLLRAAGHIFPDVQQVRGSEPALPAGR